MAKTRNVVKNLRWETAKRERKCHTNSKHTIEAGENHLAEYDDAGNRQNICKECAQKVLAVAEKHICDLKKNLP
ncbi:hypothetical protein WJ59_17385 [Burkholderia gladioli]|nr:hypothetical protein WJ59_17385 [Burkholderia gladioli]